MGPESIRVDQHPAGDSLLCGITLSHMTVRCAVSVIARPPVTIATLSYVCGVWAGPTCRHLVMNLSEALNMQLGVFMASGSCSDSFPLSEENGDSDQAGPAAGHVPGVELGR